jgi:AIPR protein
MSTNDRIILDTILEQKRQELAPSLSASKFFEIFTAGEVLKDYDLSYEEIESGIVGDGGDGGVDAIFLFANGELVQDDTDTSSLKKNVSVELILIQAKTSPSFSESSIDKLKAFTEDLLDLSKDVDKLTSVYNADVISSIRRFRSVYGALASRFPKLTVTYKYGSKGDQVHPNVHRKAELLKDTVRQLFSSAEVNFHFLGASQLLSLAHRTARKTYMLRLAENPISSSGAVAFVCLVNLKDYYAFICDEKGTLARSIFESNVRDYQGATEVNEQIQTTLLNNHDDDFWWLNNGITIVATQATQSGKSLTIEDPQIVNGLQTSNVLYNHFKAHNTDNISHNLLVRVIVPPAAESRDRIIKATNSQTQIPIASLRATELIHRDIEEYLRPNGLFYDRRKNFYKNEGKPIEKIVSIPSLAQAIMAIALQRPNDARARPSSLLKRPEEYDRVFSRDYPIGLYLTCALLLKRVDETMRLETSNLDKKDQTNLRFYVAMDVACTSLGKAAPTPVEIAALSVHALSEDTLKTSQQRVLGLYSDLGPSDQTAKGPDLAEKLKQDLKSRYSS